MVKDCKPSFRPVEFRTQALTIIRGGHLSRECLLHSKEVELPGCERAETFIKVQTRDPWLTQAVMGKAFRGEIYPGVLTDLRDKVVAAERRLRLGLPEDEDEPLGKDPMDEMEVDDTPHSTDRRVPRRIRRQNKGVFSQQVLKVVMKECPSADLERTVTVFLGGFGRLWVRKEDICWLIRTLSIQQELRGVTTCASDDEGPEAVLTPEKHPKPQECEGHVHDTLNTPP